VPKAAAAWPGAAPAAPPAASADALPEEVVAGAGNWLTRYRMYRVFSWPWFRGRLRLGMALIGAITLLNVAAVALRLPAAGWAVVLEVGAWVLVSWTLIVNLGPLLACWLRSRLAAGPVQDRAIVAVLALVIAAAAPFNDWVSERINNQIDSPAVRAEREQRRAELRSRPALVRYGAQAIGWAATAAITFAIGGGIAGVAFFRERTRLADYARRREFEREQAARHEAELRLSVMQAQIEPHFLFNTLAGLRSLIVHDPARAAELVDKLTDYLRATMPRTRASDGAALPALLGQQLDAAASYLGLMQLRIGERRLAYELHSEPGLREQPFPPLMLLTLVENAIKHGIEPKTEGGRIVVDARREGGQLLLEVADSGVGFGVNTSSGGGIGLANIRNRLRQIYGERARLELSNRPSPLLLPGADSGFSALIRVPLDAGASAAAGGSHSQPSSPS
jgi:hypothetical protein